MNLDAYLYQRPGPLALRKWRPEYQRYHYWIGFSDFHDKTHKDNVPQRKIIEDNLDDKKSIPAKVKTFLMQIKEAIESK